MSVITYQLHDSIRTDYTGFKQLFKLYHDLKEHYNRHIFLDFEGLEWIDANLSSVFESILYKLKKENNLEFSANVNIVSDKFNVLLRNGFITFDNEATLFDDRKSTVPCRSFLPLEKEGFKSYIESDLLNHRGFPDSLTANQRKRIKVDLLEIFSNVYQHALTDDPFFVCGQYFPKEKLLKFTMSDLGCGFLPPIRDFSNNDIETDIDAIRWALSGKSIKLVHDEPGGCGLSGIHEYCIDNDGNFQIVTGEAFWGLDLENTLFKGSRGFEKPFVGTTINIFFKC